MLQRAYSLLEIKAVDDAERIIEGIASTPQSDRDGDVMEPTGAEFELPMPLLWQHRHDTPIGHVLAARVTPDGIWIRAQISKLTDPSPLTDQIESAWAAVKARLVRGFSVGFRVEPGDVEPIRGKGNRIKRWLWLETSAVTIPANAGATIDVVKSADAEYLAASGQSSTPPRVRGSVKMLPLSHNEGTVTIQEQIKGFEATRAAKAAAMAEIMSKSAATGETLDGAQTDSYDTLADEVKQLDAHLARLAEFERMNLASAKAVAGTTTTDAAGSRGSTLVVKAEERLEKGIEFARFAMCIAAAKGNVPQALDLAKTHYPQQRRAIDVLGAAAGRGSTVEKMVLGMKAAVGAGTTTDATWAGPLTAYNTFMGDFVDYLRPRTIIGQFGQNGIPDLKRIPFNVHIKGQTSGGSAGWTGEGKPKPVTRFDFNDVYHGYAKVAAISVITEELIRFSDPSAEAMVREGLAGALIERIDTDFVDPDKGLVQGVSPASITNDVVAGSSSGDDGDAVRADIAQLWGSALAANLPLTSAVYITTPAIALGLSLLMNALGQREFPDVSMSGGRLLGVPVLVSNYVPEGSFILAFASEIFLSDDSTVTVDASREASIEMIDAPTQDAEYGTGASLVSMYQTDSVALRAHRFINWSKRRASAVAMLEDVSWGGVLS